MIRGFIIAILGLAFIYVCLALYSRAVRKDKLERWYEDSDKSVDLDTYVAQGLSDYHQSFRKKLLLLVFIVPIAGIVIAVYMQNFM